jgi:nitronate monooxygenase
MDVGDFPELINGGMGVAVSNWKLARVVSMLGQGGVVSGTALNVLLARRLQDGDSGGHMRRALEYFPFPSIAQQIMDRYFIEGGRKPGQQYKLTPLPQLNAGRDFNSLCVAANFAEVFLAKEGHGGFVGINYLEKIQFPHPSSLFGAMLAGADAIFIGAGLPDAIPNVLESLVQYSPAKYPINVESALAGEKFYETFDPNELMKEGGKIPSSISKPFFVPIIGGHLAGMVLLDRTNGRVDAFDVEDRVSGGHNSPPRKKPMELSALGEPVYGIKDEINFEKIRALGKPFWLAGGYGSREGFLKAKSLGARGVVVGTALALSTDSGLREDYRRQLVIRALEGKAEVLNDPLASPAGFPFRVVKLEGTLSEEGVYSSREKVCDLGFLRTAYRKPDGNVGYRCPAEPEADFLRKGGKLEEIAGRKCICNGLISSAGAPQLLSEGRYEPGIVTLGADYPKIVEFCRNGNPDYNAERVINIILGKEN